MLEDPLYLHMQRRAPATGDKRRGLATGIIFEARVWPLSPAVARRAKFVFEYFRERHDRCAGVWGARRMCLAGADGWRLAAPCEQRVSGFAPVREARRRAPHRGSEDPGARPCGPIPSRLRAHRRHGTFDLSLGLRSLPPAQSPYGDSACMRALAISLWPPAVAGARGRRLSVRSSETRACWVLAHFDWV